jgi:hypothetical protein
MNKNRTYLIILISLIVSATVIVTRLYEFSVLQQRPVVPVIRPGYQLFKKETNGFTFHYPIGWVYKPLINTPHFANGIFLNGSGISQLYLETPYSGRGFLFTFKGQQPYYSANISATPTPVISVTSTVIQTNDPSSPIIFNVYKPCVLVPSSTNCIQENGGGFMVGVWQRGKASPILSDRNQSEQTGVLYSELPSDAAQRNHLITQFVGMLRDLNFNDPNVPASSTPRWKFFNDPNGVYKINYPPDFSLNENINLNYTGMTTGTAIEYSKDYTEGTNLSEARVLIGPVLPEYAGETCLPQNGISTPPEPVTVNGVNYLKSVGAGAAAGNRYDTITYAFNKNGVCYNVALFLHSTVRENYPENLRPKPYDQQKVVNIFSEIFATFSPN